MPNDSPPVLPSNRSFGLLFTLVFGLVGAWMAWRRVAAYPWWLGASAATLLVTLVWPSLLAPFNRAWMKLAELLNRIVSPLVLGILFFGLVTPIGFLRRLSGWDPMSSRYDAQAKSYWIERDPPGPPSDSLKNQY